MRSQKGTDLRPFGLPDSPPHSGDTSEKPFENSINDVPLTAICCNIEIHLRETLGETDIPKRVQAVENILM